MFVVRHVNFGTCREFDTFAEAKAWATKACFEAAVYRMHPGQGGGAHQVALFSPVSGWSVARQG